MKKEEKETVRSALENIFGIFEGLSGIKIPRCYSNEPCEYFPNHTDVQKTYVSWWKYRRENMDGIDVESLIKDLRIREAVLYPPNSHHHVIIIKDIACSSFCERILLGMTWPIVPSSLPSYEEGSIFRAPGVAVISVGSIKMFYGDKWQKAFLIRAAYELGRLYRLSDSYCSYPYCVMGGRHDKENIDKILKNNPHLYCRFDLQYLRINLKMVHGGLDSL